MSAFKNSVHIHITLFIVSGICQLIVLSNVIGRTVSIWSLLFWILSIVCLYLAFPFLPRKDTPYKRSSYETFPFVFVIILLAMLVRVVLMWNTGSFHIDEYLSAYYSYTLADFTKLDWFGMYPAEGNYIWHFPVLYFFFQKLFFNLFGLSTLTMRFSIIPILFLYLSFFFCLQSAFTAKKLQLLQY